jgi:hypothetical protein
MMKKVVTALIASMVVASPALAQYGPGPRPQPWNPNAFWRGAPANPYDRIQFLQERINRGVADGSLDRREAMRATRELNGVRQWMRRMHWENGGRLTPDQRARVQARLDALSRQIRWMRHNGW